MVVQKHSILIIRAYEPFTIDALVFLLNTVFVFWNNQVVCALVH